jgi:hypothetical protein
VYPRTVMYHVASDLSSLWSSDTFTCRNIGPYLPVEVCSGAVMYSVALGLASLLSLAPTLPHVPQLRISPPVEVGSGAVTCLMALASAFPRGEF